MGLPGRTSLGKQVGTPVLGLLGVEAHNGGGLGAGGVPHPPAVLGEPPSAEGDSPSDVWILTPALVALPPRQSSVSQFPFGTLAPFEPRGLIS